MSQSLNRPRVGDPGYQPTKATMPGVPFQEPENVEAAQIQIDQLHLDLAAIESELKTVTVDDYETEDAFQEWRVRARNAHRIKNGLKAHLITWLKKKERELRGSKQPAPRKEADPEVIDDGFESKLASLLEGLSSEYEPPSTLEAATALRADCTARYEKMTTMFVEVKGSDLGKGLKKDRRSKLHRVREALEVRRWAIDGAIAVLAKGHTDYQRALPRAVQRVVVPNVEDRFEERLGEVIKLLSDDSAIPAVVEDAIARKKQLAQIYTKLSGLQSGLQWSSFDPDVRENRHTRIHAALVLLNDKREMLATAISKMKREKADAEEARRKDRVKDVRADDPVNLIFHASRAIRNLHYDRAQAPSEENGALLALMDSYLRQQGL